MSESGPSQGPRRLVFGEVAELYHRRRPGDPAALVDDLVAWAGEGVRGVRLSFDVMTPDER